MAAATADLIDAEINNLDVSDVQDRSNEQRRDDPDDDEDDDSSTLTRVQLLTASCRRLHREIMIDTQSCQREYTARHCQTCVRITAVHQSLCTARYLLWYSVRPSVCVSIQLNMLESPNTCTSVQALQLILQVEISMRQTLSNYVSRSSNQIKSKCKYLTCDQKLTGSQFSLPHVPN